MTTLNEAFRVMTGSLDAVSGRRSQVRGVIAWEQVVAHAEECAEDCGREAELPGEPFAVRLHLDWQKLCALITEGLRAHANDAHVLHCEAQERARAAGSEKDQADSEARVHAAERDRHRAWAASAPDDRLRGSCESVAAAEGAACAEKAAVAAAAGQRHAESLAAAENAMAWRVAALKAAGAGDLLVMSEDAEVAPLIRAYANAGGQVAGAKDYHQGGAAA